MYIESIPVPHGAAPEILQKHGMQTTHENKCPSLSRAFSFLEYLVSFIDQTQVHVFERHIRCRERL